MLQISPYANYNAALQLIYQRVNHVIPKVMETAHLCIKLCKQQELVIHPIVASLILNYSAILWRVKWRLHNIVISC